MKFKIGDKVEKVKSYKFDGIIVGIFKKTDGKILLNVEHKDGWVHIFREEDIRKIKLYKCWMCHKKLSRSKGLSCGECFNELAEL